MGMYGAVRRDFDNVAGVTLTWGLILDSDEWGESGCRCGVQQGSQRREDRSRVVPAAGRTVPELAGEAGLFVWAYKNYIVYLGRPFVELPHPS